jgi:hypothetical protein
MQRITTSLIKSEAKTVSNAVCLAGGKTVVITSASQSHDAWQWCVGAVEDRGEDFVRLEVIADEYHSAGVISAIKKTSSSGKIIVVFNQ